MPKSDLTPPGFLCLGAGRIFLVVDPALEETARALSLDRPGGIDRLFAGGGGASGRGDTALVDAPGKADKLVLRRLIHGGLLGPLRGSVFFGMGRPLRELRVTPHLVIAGSGGSRLPPA